MSMKIVTALVGVILLVSGIVLGASAGQLPVISFLTAEKTAVRAPQTSPTTLSFEAFKSRLQTLPQEAQQEALQTLYRVRRRAIVIFAPLTGAAAHVPQPVVQEARCENPAQQGVDWHDCPAREAIIIDSADGDSLQDADLRGTGLIASTLINLNMAGAQIEGLDLATAFMVNVDLTGATGSPKGDDVFMMAITCPDGSYLANASGDAADACPWLPAASDTQASPTAAATPTLASGEPGAESAEPDQSAATATATPTATAVSEATATPTPEAAVPVEEAPQNGGNSEATCEEGVGNGGFEIVDAWVIPATQQTAVYSQDQARSGAWSLRTGIGDGELNIYSFSSARQRVVIPAGSAAVTLSFYLFQQSDEPASYIIPASISEALNSLDSNLGDAQWVILYNSRGQELQRLVSERSDARAWTYFEFDLSPYTGQSVEIYFGTFNSGSGGISAMFVDDVSIRSCADAAETTATPTQTATATSTPTATTTPEESPLSAFLPGLFGDVPVGLNGRVLNPEGTPQPGVEISITSSSGGQGLATTDAAGYYAFDDLPQDSYTVDAPLPLIFQYEPQSYLADVPPSAGSLNFTAVTVTPSAYP